MIAALLSVAALAGAEVRSAMELPTIPTTTERVAENVSTGVIHGWHSNHLIKYKDVLYADGRVPDPAANNKWKCSGAFWRREADGRWTKVAAVPQPPYLLLMGPAGRMWQVAPSDYAAAEVWRMRRPLDFADFEMPYNGTCAYMGAGIDAEGNFLLLHAESGQMTAGRPNALIQAFYDAETGKWHKGRFVTSEGRYGYIGIVLKGRKALAVLNSALQDPKAVPTPPHYTWRHVRLARCDDLTTGQWVHKPFLMPQYGDTALNDMVEAPDGQVYLSYNAREGDSFEAMRAKPHTHYIARFKPDLTADVHATGIPASATRILHDRHGRWYLLGQPNGGGDLRLWALDPGGGFKPTRQWVLPGTDKLEGYVIHTLCPERFGGEDGGDTIHLLTARYLDADGNKPSDKPAERAEIWYARFDLP